MIISLCVHIYISWGQVSRKGAGFQGIHISSSQRTRLGPPKQLPIGSSESTILTFSLVLFTIRLVSAIHLVVRNAMFQI